MKYFFSLLIFVLLMTAVTPALQAANNSKEEENLRKTQEIAEGKMALNGESGDTWILASWDWIKKHCVAFGKWSYKQGHEIICEDFAMPEANKCSAFAMLFVASVCMLSGGWAGSVAQMRRHNKWRFFWAGFFTFFIMPVYLLLKLDIKGERERLARMAEEAEKKREAKAEQARKEAEIKAEQGVEAPAVSEEGVVWNREYFTKIARLSDGTPDGPWDVCYNGVAVRVLQIIDPQDEFVQVRLLNQENKTMNGRIPYARIEKWDKVTE